MNEKTLLFYDLETSGLNKSFAQVVEFAAIRTDMDLCEIERTHFYVKLTRDVIPEPDAFATHRLSLKTLAGGLAEPEAMAKIHGLLNQPGTISLGYNTLGFDDEFLRFSFYRALLTPYTHQYSQGCGRMDLYPIAVLYRLFQPDVMQWPQTEAGFPTMKLEHIAAYNGWLTGQAHHAMTDVEATVSLARALAESSAMWEYVAGYFDKKTDWQRTQDLCASLDFQGGVQCPVGLLVMGQFGVQSNFVVPALCLGIHKHYRNQAIWLRLDKADLGSIAQVEDVQAYQRFIIRKKLGEGPFVLPAKPRYTAALSAQVADVMTANIEYLQQQIVLPTLQDSLLTQKYVDVEGVDVDARLYMSGFPSDETVALCRDLVQQLAQSGDASLLPAIYDAAVRARAQRYIWRHYADALPAACATECTTLWENLVAGTPRLDFTGQAYVTPEQALLRCQALLAEPDLASDQQAVLTEVHHYLRTHFVG